MSIAAIRNVRWRDHPGLWTFRLEAGRVKTVDPAGVETAGPPALAGDEIDAGGGFITPALVDAHVHLDLAYSLALVAANESGTLREAIAHWAQAKRELTAEDVQQRAERAIRAEIGFGTGFLRTHVDVGSAAGLRLCEGVLAAREATRDACKIQIAAFPQDGLVRDPRAVDNIRSAMQSGGDLIGGIPHIERVPRDGLEHLRIVFDLAEEFDANIDCHIDETDDPQSMHTEQLAAMTIDRGWQGRVTASHVCALASYDDVHAAKVVDLLAEARISVVTNPGVNLHLQGRYDGYPKRRGLTRVRELLDAGIVCGAGQDCIQDPFYPFGRGQMLEQVFLLVHAEHMSSPRRMQQAMEMVCCEAGKVVGLGHHRPEPLAPANLAVWPVAGVADLIRQRPLPLAVVHDGRLVAGTLAGEDEPAAAG